VSHAHASMLAGAIARFDAQVPRLDEWERTAAGVVLADGRAQACAAETVTVDAAQVCTIQEVHLAMVLGSRASAVGSARPAADC
jgi:hypothetical protein